MELWKRELARIPLPYNYVNVPQVEDPPNRPQIPLRYFVNQVVTNLTRSAFHHAGFTYTTDHRAWNASWGRQYTMDRYRQCQAWQKVNHFAGAYLMGRKDHLHDRMTELRSRTGDFASFYPESYLIPRESAGLLEQWLCHRLWIFKPSASSRGRGIRL
jgi:tubulin polyglutamylase TTLL4